MNGLLGSIDDPKTAGLLSLGLRLMSTPGKFTQALGQSGLGAMGDMQQAQQMQDQRKRQALQEQMLMMQLQQQQEQAAAQKAAEQKRSDFLGDASGQYGPARPFDMARAMQAGMPIEAIKLMAAQNAPKEPPKPLISKPGDIARDPVTGAQLWANPAESKPTSDQQNYAQAVKDGFRGSFMDYQTALKRSGATNVSVNSTKPMVNEIAGGLGKQIDNSFANAQAAVPSINTAHTLRAAVDTGKIVAGPGAKFRVFGLQVGQMLGVGGKDGAEVLANTRTAIQAMAQAELSAAEQMKGQGQITEAERAIIRRAAAGDINELTAPEVRLLSEVMEKTARFKISRHKKNVEGLGNVPGAEALLPFYQLDEPPPYSAQGPVRRYNPATGKIE